MVGLSLTMMDQISGPFQLELKDISLMVDHGNDGEEFAYEMYKIPHFWAGHWITEQLYVDIYLY